MKRRGKSKLRFVALGGGQEVGASCYFLQINDAYILLDCGKSPAGSYFPDFTTILKPPFLESLNQINQIFISHSHYDHIGALRDLIAQCRNAGIYATPVTKALIFHILWNLNNRHTKYAPEDQRERDEILADTTVRSIIETGYCSEIPLPGYTATLYEAGHIPGAAMVYLQTADRRILYTGDFSCRASALTSPYILPDNIDFDTVIICGLHAKNPYIQGRDLQSQLSFIKRKLKQGQSVHLKTVQLTKGWEILHIINEEMRKKNMPLLPIYMNHSLFLLAEEMERMHISVRKSWNYRGMPSGREQCIIIGRSAPQWCAPVKVDFSLHPTYRELADFIEKYNPRTVVVVHTGTADPQTETNCLEMELMTKASCTSQFIYAETGAIYTL